MPIPKQYAEIVDLIIDRTQKGELDWKELRHNDLVVPFDDLAFNVWYWTSEYDDTSGYSAGLCSPDGKVIDSFTVPPGDPHFPKLAILFEGARRKARNVDAALVKIRAALTKPPQR